VPNRRISAAQDSAGRISAEERERYAYATQLCERAEAAGLDLDANDWYRDAVRMMCEVSERCTPCTPQLLSEMKHLNRSIVLGFETYAPHVDTDGLIPTLPDFYDLQRRTLANREL
jgi:hypothetical protein